jgi:N-acetylglucosamine-6-phosphate deacetylase
MSLLIRGARRLDGGGIVDIAIEGDRIVALEPAGTEPADTAARVLDAEGLQFAPGFIELQVNGAAGHDLTADPASMWQVGEALPRYGITAFLATIVTASEGTPQAAIEAFSSGPPDGYRGARALGVHLEGPFLSPARHGAHEVSLLRDPDEAMAAGWSADAGVRLVTLAPELSGALDLIRTLVDRGVVVSLGHSAATRDQAMAGFDAGARYVTHLFNGMSPLDHREPGLPGAALLDDRVTVGLIPDGIHVHPDVVALVRRLVGPDRLSIVTDAIAALGMTPGRYRLAGQDVMVDETSARLADGRLAGAVIPMDAAVRNLRHFTGCSLEDAVGAVTEVPARLLGLEGSTGTVAVGAPADLVLLTADAKVAVTIVGGQVVFERTETSPA